MGGKSSGGGARMPSPSEYIPLVNAQAQANRVNTYTPFGSTVFSPVPTSPSAPPTMGVQQSGGPKMLGPVMPGLQNQNNVRHTGAGIDRSRLAGGSSARTSGGGKFSSLMDGANEKMQSSITPMQSVTSFSPELQRLFDQQTGMAGSMVGDPMTRARQNAMAFSPVVNPALRARQGAIASSPVGDQEMIARQRQMTFSPIGNQDVIARQSSLAMNPENFNQQIEQATFQRAMNLMEPGFQQQQRRFEQEMANRGLPVGGEAYNDQFQNIQRAQNSARENAALSAVLAGNDAALRSRGQNFGELGSLVNQDLALRGRSFDEMSTLGAQDLARRAQGFGELGSLAGQDMTARGQSFGELGQLTSQDFAQRGQQFNELASILGQNQVAPTAPVDVMGPANMALNRNIANQQAQQGKKSSGVNAGAMLGSAALMAPSDRRLKTGIERVGTLPLPLISENAELPLYRFRYTWSPMEEIGVMSDEVREVIPEAVFTRDDGYEMVDYGLLLSKTGRRLNG